MCGTPNTPKPPPPPQPAKPAIETVRRTGDRRKSGAMGPSTLLTGPSGVSNAALRLGGGNLLLGQ